MDQALWVTEWDDYMISFLTPLANSPRPPRMQLLFYANSFPLCYHYAQSLLRKGTASCSPNRLIRLGSWNEENAQIRYANEMSRADAEEERAFVPITTFNPRWAFVPHTLSTHDIWRRAGGKANEGCYVAVPALAEFLAHARADDYTVAWIYAELHDLGNYLRELLAARFPENLVFCAQAEPADEDEAREISSVLPSFQMPAADEPILRLFVFGGSLSSYMLQKKSRYLPLALPDNGGRFPSSMQVLLMTPLEWEANLRDYHRALYASAAGVHEGDTSSSCPPFFTVYRSYNEVSWLLQHRSSFTSAEAYAECLRDHHLPHEGERSGEA